MIRDLRRAWRGFVAERRIAPRRAAVRRDIERHLGGPVTLALAGSRGRDSVYRVLRDARVVGMLRLVNPYRRRRAPVGMPYVWPEDGARLERERTSYELGAAHGLTPRPSWHAGDALLVEHVAGERLSERLEREPARFWTLMARGARSLAALHGLGITHMDASLANLIAVREREALVCIDFEYAPAPGLAPAAQRLYDHLRLVESSLKMVPPEVRGAPGEWLAVLDELLEDDVRRVDPAPLAPALVRLLAEPPLLAALAPTLPRLAGRA